MRGSIWGAGLVLFAGLLGNCGGRAASDGASRASSGAGAGSSATQRVPLRHRANGTTCPDARGSYPVRNLDFCTDRQFIDCTSDTDCTAGKNGRCSNRGPFACVTGCNYDECNGDDYCGAGQPCECRDTETSPAANACVTSGNCRIDADCGANGFCSPSVVSSLCQCLSTELCTGTGMCSPGQCACGDSCGHGYFCHTASDACVDDADCGGNATCNYDRVHERWECEHCSPVL